MAEAGFPAGRRQPRHRLGRGGRRRDRRQPGRGGHLVHRLVGDRQATSPSAAGRRLKRVSLELGGKNGVVVLADADLDLATDGILWSAFGTTGQRCTAASRVIVERSSSEPLLQRLEIAGRRPPARLRPRPGRRMSGRSSTPAPSTRSRRYVEIGRGEGELVIGGGRATGGDLAHGHFFEPTIFAGVGADGPDRPGGDLRAGPVGHPGRRLRRRDARAQPDPLRPVVEHLHPRRQPRPSGRCATSRPASSTSTRARPAPRSTCRSAAGRRPATATARPATSRSTRTPSGSRSTSTSRGRLQRAQIDNQPG